MTGVPVWMRFAFAVVLILTMVIAFWGRPPRRRTSPALWRRLAGCGAVMYTAGCGALLMDETVISAALVGAGVETLSVVAWLGRGFGEDDDGGGGGSDDDPDSGDRGDDGDNGPQWNVDDERAFRDYARRGPQAPIAG
jgi:hypothetical protein